MGRLTRFVAAEAGGSERWFGNMADAILAAGADPARWCDIPAQLAEGWPGVKVILLGGSTDEQSSFSVAYHGLDPGWMRDYNRYYFQFNPWTPIIQRMPVLRASTTEDILPWRAFADGEFYNDFLKPQGETECGAGIKLFDDRDRSAALSFQYGSGMADRYDRELPRVLERLAPLLRAAVALNRELARTESEGAVTAAALDAILAPALVVDRHASLRLANARAVVALERADIARLDSRGRIRLVDPAATSALLDSLRGLSQTHGKAVGDEILVRSSDGVVTATVAIHPVSAAASSNPGLAWLMQPERLAVLVVRSLSERPFIAADALQRAFALTSAEARIAARLATGERLDDVADALGVSKETARTHLHAIFAKTGTHRQSELVALLTRLAR